MEGYLKKKGLKHLSSYKKRWVVCKESQLFDYKNKGDVNHAGCIDLSASDASPSQYVFKQPSTLFLFFIVIIPKFRSVQFGFDLCTPTRNYRFQASSNEERGM